MIKKLKNTQVYIANISWIMSEKVLVMGITFAITVVLARFLGPEQFGILSYAISLVSIFGISGHMGLSGLVVRELVREPYNKNIVMGTSFFLKCLGYLLGFLLILIIAFVTEPLGSNEFWVLLIVSFGLMCKPFDVIDFWFQSILQVKYTAISRCVAAVLSSALQLLLVFLGAELLFFASAHLIQTFISSTLLIFYLALKSNIHIRYWRFSKHKAKELFNQGWMVFLGSIFAIIYLKVDQVMLKWFVGNEEVGVYAIAATISEAWYFVPVAIVASFFPKLIKLREDETHQYHYRLQQLFDFLFIIAVLVAILVTFFAEMFISLLFGEAYSKSIPILIVHIWAALFIFMRAAFSKWILIENVLLFSLVTQGLGALTNIVLNIWLIPLYAGLGAAYATLFSYAMASYIALLFHSKTRIVFIMMSKSFVLPIRYFFYMKEPK